MSDGQDHTVSRRGFLTGAGLGALGAAGVAGGAAWLTSSETAAADTVDFDGPH